MGEFNEAVIPLSDPDLGRVSDQIDARKDNLHAKTKVQKLLVSDSSNVNNASNHEELSTDPNTKQDHKPNEILPCPRCKSKNTKFCYFNNQNINQPRHFCKNCQRYWTSGGSMRNVPVGSGKRKSKHSINHLSIEQNNKKPFNPVLISPTHEIVDTPSSSVEPHSHNPEACFSPQGPEACFSPHGYPGLPWAYSWAPPMMMAPPSNIPFQFFPMFPVFPDMSSSANHCEGKKEEERKTIWAPKTLRVDNPEEAAKSSIWSTLGIKRDESVKRDWLFRGFQSSNESSGYNASNAAKVSHLNPAAMARSQLFQERA